MDQAEGCVFSHPLSLITSLPDIFSFYRSRQFKFTPNPRANEYRGGIFIQPLGSLFLHYTSKNDLKLL